MVSSSNRHPTVNRQLSNAPGSMEKVLPAALPAAPPAALVWFPDGIPEAPTALTDLLPPLALDESDSDDGL